MIRSLTKKASNARGSLYQNAPMDTGDDGPTDAIRSSKGIATGSWSREMLQG